MCSLCWLPVAENHNFWQISNFWGLLYRPPFTYEGQIWCAIADPQRTFTCQKLSRSVNSIALWRRKNPVFAVFLDFGIYLVMSTVIGSNLTKLYTGAQLQTFLYPTASISFLYSKVFMVKSGAQRMAFKSVTERQKLNFFRRPGGGEIRSPPNLAW